METRNSMKFKSLPADLTDSEDWDEEASHISNATSSRSGRRMLKRPQRRHKSSAAVSPPAPELVHARILNCVASCTL
eukprot:4099987-Prymnesium_polylepis.1